MCGEAQHRHRRVCMGRRQIEWPRPWKDKLIIFCHSAEHLHISSPLTYIIINISRVSEELIYHQCRLLQNNVLLTLPSVQY